MERIRVSAKETAKAVWTFEATAEMESELVNEADLASKLLSAVTECERRFTDAGKIVAGAEPAAP